MREIFSLCSSAHEQGKGWNVRLAQLEADQVQGWITQQQHSQVGTQSNNYFVILSTLNACRPGGGDVKIESRKLEWKSGGRTNARNDGYTPKGGDKKVMKTTQKESVA